jgi:hypothetical protein
MGRRWPRGLRCDRVATKLRGAGRGCDAESDRTALHREASDACCDRELDRLMSPIEHNQKDVSDRG